MGLTSEDDETNRAAVGFEFMSASVDIDADQLSSRNIGVSAKLSYDYNITLDQRRQTSQPLGSLVRF